MTVREQSLTELVLPRLLERVFHVTSGERFEQIRTEGRVRVNADGKLGFSFDFSRLSHFRLNGCVSVCDLRGRDHEELDRGRSNYDFVQPSTSWSVIAYLFLSEEARDRVITWEQATTEHGLTIQGVPRIEAGHPGPIPVEDLEEVLLVTVLPDPSLHDLRNRFHPGNS